MQASSFRFFLAVIVATIALLLLAAQLAASAEPEYATAAAGVGVARISLIQGSVAVQRGDSATPTGAVVNAPILGADYVTTGNGSRAEIQFDNATALRLGGNVQIRFTHLDANQRILQLAEGTVELRLLRGTDGRSQIDTPSISIRPQMSGSYRVSVDRNGITRVTVRAGRADIVTAQGTQSLGPDVTLQAQGSASQPWIEQLEAIAYDDFDRFNRDRDDRAERALADAAYVAPGVAGVDDLNAYGRWVNDGSYGQVWVPNAVTSDWAPYRYGRWAWEGGFGWTWIGFEPWGWAPYHYGRWFHHRFYGWCWYPQRTFIVWQPALVAFLTFGGGNIGWVGLAPFEPFTPWWFNGFSGTTPLAFNNGQITRMYGNARYNGVTYTPGQRFLEGRFDRLAAAPPSKLRSVEIVRGAPPVVPTQANLRYTERPVSRELAVRPTFTSESFAGGALPVARIPFDQQRASVAAVVHARSETPVVTQVAPRAPVRAVEPWSRFSGGRGAAPTTPVMVIYGNTSGSAAPKADSNTTPTRTTGSNAGMLRAHDSDAWVRFEASAPRSAFPRDVPHELPHGTAAVVNDRPRTYIAPTRRTTIEEQPRSYPAPQVEHAMQPAAPMTTRVENAPPRSVNAPIQRGEPRGFESRPNIPH